MRLPLSTLPGQYFAFNAGYEYSVIYLRGLKTLRAGVVSALLDCRIAQFEGDWPRYTEIYRRSWFYPVSSRIAQLQRRILRWLGRRIPGISPHFRVARSNNSIYNWNSSSFSSFAWREFHDIGIICFLLFVLLSVASLSTLRPYLMVIKRTIILFFLSRLIKYH